MFEIISEIDHVIEKKSMLLHAFYQAWDRGELTREVLCEYSKQYFRHVNDFPRYLSAIHTSCEDISNRQVILGNLRDEEEGEDNHPELWLRFAEALGVSRDEVLNADLHPETRALGDSMFEAARSSYAEGVGSLYAYEKQVPEIARRKIEGLKSFYGISEEKALKFFTVHMSADEWHSSECAELIKKMSTEDQLKAKKAAEKTADMLLSFLDGMEKFRLESLPKDYIQTHC